MVEIAPKPKTKSKKAPTILLSIGLILLILSIGAYFGLRTVELKKQKELKEMQEQLAQHQTALKKLEDKLLTYKTKLDDLSLVLDSRLIGTNFFSFLERIIHKEVMLEGVEINLAKGTAEIYGKAKSLPVLTQQLIFLKTVPEIQSFELKNIALEEKGEVSFAISLILSPTLFK